MVAVPGDRLGRARTCRWRRPRPRSAGCRSRWASSSTTWPRRCTRGTCDAPWRRHEAGPRYRGARPTVVDVAARSTSDQPERRTVEFPDDLRYTNEHEWVRVEGSVAKVGITDYAQDALGDVVYVDLPEVGASVDGEPAARRGGVDEVGLRRLQPDRRHGRPEEPVDRRTPRARERAAVRRRMARRDRADGPRSDRRRCSTRPRTGRSSTS